MIILNRWEEKCLQILTFVVSMVDVVNNTINTVIDRKIDIVNKEIKQNSWME